MFLIRSIKTRQKHNAHLKITEILECRVKIKSFVNRTSLRMIFFMVFALYAAFAAAEVQPQHYSYSPSVGSGSGSEYTLTGNQRITAVRVWENYSGNVRSIQFRYGNNWSNVAGYLYGTPLEMELYDGEAIVEISGKYAYYLEYVVFTTNRGRFIHAGQPSGSSFNMYPSFDGAELVYISGRQNGAITSLGAHWAVVKH
ncbi:zymogen granule membrane protein 16-like isoform X2 [Oryzias latipes]|uniref:zymogen granule membrane protein 16-like isoform X2 n=1 Tax=Oryzias latipes TaxID=8090 RepID=UPI0009DB3FDC|nr:zymogen granule membrane protein 16-like isoform X2 [Oryzias latipes]